MLNQASRIPETCRDSFTAHPNDTTQGPLHDCWVLPAHQGQPDLPDPSICETVRNFTDAAPRGCWLSQPSRNSDLLAKAQARDTIEARHGNCGLLPRHPGLPHVPRMSRSGKACSLRGRAHCRKGCTAIPGVTCTPPVQDASRTALRPVHSCTRVLSRSTLQAKIQSP